MNTNEIKALVAQAIMALERAEQLLPKPVMSTDAGRDIAAASHHAVQAYKKLCG